MKLTSENIDYLSHCAITAAELAGEMIAGYADKDFEVLTKEGGDSPASQVVTEVDLRSEKIIAKVLQPTLEEFELGLLTEESIDNRGRLIKDYFWCIDPIDGTLSFIEGVPGYAVSIALVSKSGEPLIGVVYDPLHKILYSAVKEQGALRNGQPWTLDPAISICGNPLTLAIDRSMESQSNYSNLLQQFELIARKNGANGLNFLRKGGAVMNGCWVLENPPGCYIKFPKHKDGGGSLWDFAAITCLFHELGAIATDFHGQALELNRAESTFMNHRGVLFITNQSFVADIQSLDFRG